MCNIKNEKLSVYRISSSLGNFYRKGIDRVWIRQAKDRENNDIIR